MTMHEDRDAALRMALLGLRRDEEPQQDLWPRIAAQIGRDMRGHPPLRRRSRLRAPLALAASLVIATGFAW